MTGSYWRDIARPIVAQAIDACRRMGITDPDTIRRSPVLRDAYPFGPRQYHPYRIWCSEIRRQLNIGRKLTEADLPLFLSLRKKNHDGEHQG